MMGLFLPNRSLLKGRKQETQKACGVSVAQAPASIAAVMFAIRSVNVSRKPGDGHRLAMKSQDFRLCDRKDEMASIGQRTSCTTLRKGLFGVAPQGYALACTA